MKGSKNGKLLIIILVVIIAIMAGTIGFMVWQNISKSNQIDLDNTSSNQTATSNQSTEQSLKTEPVSTGTISGSLTYPAGGIPESLTVHALNLDTNKEYTTSNHINDSKYQYGVGYTLEVPAGRYHVYSTLAENPGKKGYHNQFVVCGMSVSCTNTDIIEVQVRAGETTDDVTVGDWYNN